MTLRTKLVLAQLPLAVSLVVVGVVSGKTIASLDRSSQDILKDNHLSVLAAQRMRDHAEALGHAALARTDPAAPELAARRTAFARELAFQESNITEAGEREMTARLRAAWARLQGDLDHPGGDEELFAALAAVAAATNDITAVNQDAMVRKSEGAGHKAERMSTVMSAVTVAACVLGLLASMYLTNRMTRPLAVLTQAVRRIGQGDLAVRARIDGRDEIAQVAGELNTMTQKLMDYRSSSLGELLRAQQSAQAAIDSLPDPVLVLQLGGSLINANREAEAVFDVVPDAPDEAALARLPAEVQGLLVKLREHVASGRGAYVPRGLEEATAIALRDGTRYFLARGNPVLDEDGQVVALTALFQDVTRLRRFDELKNDLVATVAHEFRTPLTSLRMAIHLCVEGAAGPLTDKQADLLHAAREDCERLQGIVDDLLDLSRIQAGRIELHVRAVAASSLLAHAVDVDKAGAEERQVALAVSALTIDAAVLADPDRLQLVLGNLVSNAVRHTPPGGHVELRAAPHDGAVRFEVSDTGPGIAAEHLPRVFDRFYRVPGAPSGGAGLGLYIVKEIVEAHGGRVGVESEPGQGAIFWFTLPAAKEGAAS